MGRKRDKGVVLALRDAFMEVTMQLLTKLTRENPESVAFHRSTKQPVEKTFTEIVLKRPGCMRPVWDATTTSFRACGGKIIDPVPGMMQAWICAQHEREVPSLHEDNKPLRSKPKAGTKLRRDDEVDCADIVREDRILIRDGSGVKLGRLGTIKQDEAEGEYEGRGHWSDAVFQGSH